MPDPQRSVCPDCTDEPLGMDRRQFVKSAALGVAASTALGSCALAKPGTKPKGEPEALVKKLYDSLGAEQKGEVCFDWNFKQKGGPLRSHVSNNWSITDKTVSSKFFNKDQQEMIEAIFFGLYDKSWHDRIRKQLKDDAGGYGKSQSIAIFGKPGTGKFEFVMTGRHLTIRCDGDSTPHTAFGGPIFYGHDPHGDFYEEKDHSGNVFWPQALSANKLYQMLDGKQRKGVMVAKRPKESAVHFRGKKGGFPGLPVSELSKDQLTHLETVLANLVEPYRKTDRVEVQKCLKAQGGLEKCHIAFYKDGDIGKDGVWDNWRLEGPSFVWYFRGEPHVHVWVNIASDPGAKITSRG